MKNIIKCFLLSIFAITFSIIFLGCDEIKSLATAGPSDEEVKQSTSLWFCRDETASSCTILEKGAKIRSGEYQGTYPVKILIECPEHINFQGGERILHFYKTQNDMGKYVWDWK